VISTASLIDEDSWSPALALHVERVCKGFEAAWKSGDRPPIQPYLASTPEPGRSVLLRELLALDLEYRRGRGEEATPDDYHRQFPEHADLIRDVWRSAVPPALPELVGRPPGPGTPLPGAAPPEGRCGSVPARGMSTPAAGGPTAPALPAGGDGPAPGAARATVGRFRILRELGSGGFGVVLLAYDPHLCREVALKVPKADAMASPELRRRFRQEAQAAAGLSHPNLVPVYEAGEAGPVCYIASAYCPGITLAEWLKRRAEPVPWREAARLVATLAGAVQHAHSRGVVHRDLKPGNVLLQEAEGGARREEGEPGPPGSASSSRLPSPAFTPMITDFGLAKVQAEGRGDPTRTGAIVGTPSYMAPEQAAGGSRDVGPAADVYALGAILYELLTGRPPFQADTALEVLLLVRTEEPVPPSRLRPRLPRDLQTICLKCLEKEPRKRYAAAQALADDLRRCLEGEPVHARPAPRSERAWKWARRRPAAAALATSLGLAFFGLAGLTLWHNHDLRVKLDEALAEASLSGVRAESETLISKGQAALAEGDPQGARLYFAAALEKIGSEPTLADRRAEAERHLDATQRLLNEAAEGRHAREQYARFLRARDEALFYESEFTGLDWTANQGAMRRAAREALDLFGLATGTPAAAPWDGPHYSAGERVEVAAGCYELLLLLAEAVAQPQGAEDPRRQAEEALGLLDRAAVVRTPTRAYHLRRAGCLARLGDAAGAERERARAAALEPDGAVDHFLLGDECYRRKQPAAALDHFTTALGFEPNHFWARYLAAVCCLQSQRPAEAELHLTACQGLAQGRQREFVWVYLLRGFARGEMGAGAREAGRADEAARHFAAAEADFARAERLDPGGDARYVLLANRGVTRLQQKRYAEAVADLKDAVRLKPEQFNAYWNLARAFADQGKPEEALAQLDQAIRLRPRLGALYHLRGQIHRDRSDLAAALQDFTEATRLYEPAGLTADEARVLADAYTERGRILFHREQYEDALAAFDAALKVRPGSPRAHRLRGGVLQELHHYEEAARAYDAYFKNARPPDAEVYEARALVRAKLNDYSGAVSDLERALEVEPSSARRHRLLGWVHVLGGAYRPARDAFAEALKLDPADADAYSGRGYARVKLGETREAVADAEEALKHGPATALLLYNVARVYAQAAGRPSTDPRPEGREALLRSRYEERAVELLGKALSLEPAGRRVAFWREHVQEDAALNPVRRSVAYQRLAAEFARPVP
jgi:tetratricopeptide (TPR) repeat protein